MSGSHTLIDTHAHLCDPVFDSDLEATLERSKTAGVKAIKQLPLASILLETDSPVLKPFSGERNEPANLPCAVESISDIKGLSENAVREAAYENTLRLYGGQLAQREQRDV